MTHEKSMLNQTRYLASRELDCIMRFQSSISASLVGFAGPKKVCSSSMNRRQLVHHARASVGLSSITLCSNHSKVGFL